MRSLFCFLFFLFFSNESFCQKADSTRLAYLLEISNDFLVANQLDSARHYIDELLSTVDEKSNVEFYFKAKLTTVSILMKEGQLNDAQILIDRLDEQIEEQLERPNEIFGWAAMLKGEILYYQSSLEASYDAFENGILEFNPIETWFSYRLQARINNYQGIINILLHNTDKAILHLNRSIELYSKGSAPEVLISGVKNNLSALYMQQGKFQKALNGFFEVMETRRRILGDNDPDLVSVYTNISTIYDRMLQLNLAFEYQERAFRISEKFDNRTAAKVQQRHTIIAKMLINLGRDSLATYHLNQAQRGIDGFPGEHFVQQANIDLQWGHLYETLKEPEKSIRYFESAERNFLKGIGQADMNQVFARVGTYPNYMLLKDFKQARQKLREAVDILHNLVGNRHPHLSEAYLLMSDSYTAEENYEMALKTADLAISALPGFSLDTPENFEQAEDKSRLLLTFLKKANAHYNLYSTTKEQHHVDLALLNFNRCDVLFNELYQNDVYEDRLFTLEMIGEIYDKLVDIEYSLFNKNNQQRHLDKALSYMDRSKNVILKQALNRNKQKKYLSIPEELLAFEQELKEDISYLKSTLYDINSSTQDIKIDPTEIDRYNDELFVKNRSLDSLKKVFKSDYPSYFGIHYEEQDLSISQIQSSLNKNEQVIQFMSVKGSIFVLSISSVHSNFIRVEKEEKYHELLTEYLAKLGSSSSDLSRLSNLGYQLFTQLLQPLGQLKEQLIIVPSKELNLLPFETLVSAPRNIESKGLEYLLLSHSIGYAGSLSILYDQPKRSTNSRINLLAMASTYSNSKDEILDTLRAGLGSLKWTTEEAKSLTELYGGDLYLNSEATERNFRRNLKNKNVIHIASHGVVDNNRPLFSRLILEKDPKDSLNDGNLFVHELYNMSLDAQMVVLSACNTASGTLANGEGVLNMGRGFFYAGVPNVVMSHWQVDDQSTSILMKDFYNFLAEGKTKSESLREAKLKFIEEASPNKKHPFYWGAFISMGDDSPIVRKSSFERILTFAAIALVLIFLGLYNRRKSRFSS